MHIILIATILVVGVLVPPAAHAQMGGIEIRNQTERTVLGVRVSPDYSPSWGSNKLGNDAIPPGGRAQIDMPESQNGCFYDIMVSTNNGEDRQFWGVDLCSENSVTVR